jgi:hypothetical protein
MGKVVSRQVKPGEPGAFSGPGPYPSGDEIARSALQVYRRRDDFERVAPLLPDRGSGQETRLKFVHTEPLPLLDTGGEVILDPELAKKASVVSAGSEKGTFAGGKGADVGQGRLTSLTLGNFVVRNVPVNIQSTRRFAAAARGKQVDGILGTMLLYRFLPTFDYKDGELVLRHRRGGWPGDASTGHSSLGSFANRRTPTERWARLFVSAAPDLLALVLDPAAMARIRERPLLNFSSLKRPTQT